MAQLFPDESLIPESTCIDGTGICDAVTSLQVEFSGFRASLQDCPGDHTRSAPAFPFVTMNVAHVEIEDSGTETFATTR